MSGGTSQAQVNRPSTITTSPTCLSPLLLRLDKVIQSVYDEFILQRRDLAIDDEDIEPLASVPEPGKPAQTICVSHTRRIEDREKVVQRLSEGVEERRDMADELAAR